MGTTGPDPLAALAPELRGPVVEMMSAPMTLDDIPAARAASKGMMNAGEGAAPFLDLVESEEWEVPGPADAPAVVVRTFRPRGRIGALPALLWMHGGGYVLGSVDDDAPACARFAVEAECVTVAVEYRLAPEDPFPAALEDCYAALRWMAGGASGPAIDRSRIAIGGASAGGGLAAGLALLARDRAEVEVAFQLLVYPMLDDRSVASADDAHPEAVLWTRRNNLLAWRAYLGCEPSGEGVSCYAAASRAADLRGLAPAYVCVGDQDLFAAEDVTYARDLIRAGVPTELHVYRGGCHAFDCIAPEAEVSKRFTRDLIGALKRALR